MSLSLADVCWRTEVPGATDTTDGSDRSADADADADATLLGADSKCLQRAREREVDDNPDKREREEASRREAW